MPGLKQLLQDERGATAIEYTLVVSLISVGIIGAVTIVGIDIGHGFDDISDALSGPTSSAASTDGGPADR